MAVKRQKRNSTSRFKSYLYECSREPRGAIGELFPGKLERAVDYRNFTGPDRNCSSKSLCEAKFIRHY
jgi:hypothetical protein